MSSGNIVGLDHTVGTPLRTTWVSERPDRLTLQALRENCGELRL